MSLEKPVKPLSPEVARKIAAGEVIERPNSIIRELMDNAIDSGASSITVEINNGGIDKIRVLDNGSGLTKEDLEACARPHATSKISNENDLLSLSTLGFRGEALSSIAAVTRLSIQSGGWKMRASITEDHLLAPMAETKGTIVTSEGIFENIPARRVFLKRPQSEALMCKNTFIEKALPFTDKAFRFIQDGEIRLDLPKDQTLRERFVKGYDFNEDSSLFYEISGSSSSSETPDWSFKIVIGEPGVYRTNKKDIYIFVNGRRINEYALVQAIEYGGQGYFPNGKFPVAACFIQIKPELVDFNIHPAKKEVRFKDINSLHHGISSGVKNFLYEYTNKTMKKEPEPSFTEETLFSESSNDEDKEEEEILQNVISSNLRSKFFSTGKTPVYQEKIFSTSNPAVSHTEPVSEIKSLASTETSNAKADEIKRFTDKVIYSYNNSRTSTFSEKQSTYAPETTEQQKDDFHFLGSALGTFLVAEKNNILYIIDKHAAHERTIFDEIMKNQSKSQALLIPYIIETKDDEEEKYLESIQDELLKIGFTATKKGNGEWAFTTLNERWKGSELDLEHALFDEKVQPKDLIYSIAAMTACKAAVKDGWILDDHAAEEIARNALLLPDPHCPHGRPVYTTLSRDQLFKLVRRVD